MYADNHNPYGNDSINLWYSTNSSQPNSTIGATLLGTVYRYNVDTGWYQHSFIIPNSVRSPHVWLIFDAVAEGGFEMYIDDFSWTAIDNTLPYFCSVTNGSCGIATTNTVTITVNAPSASISGTTQVCSGNSTSLTASGGGTYLWSNSATSATVNINPNTDITYTVTITDLGCTAKTSTMVTVDNIVPIAPVAGANVLSVAQIKWNWSLVGGAEGYKYNTAKNYASAYNSGTNTSYIQTVGLSCNTAYSLYVWAYNSCGNSSYVTLTQTTSACPCGGATTMTDSS